MGKKGMVQWAPGTKMQRFNRSDPEGYKAEMEAVAKRVEALQQEPEKAATPFEIGDMILCYGVLREVESIDPYGEWVKCGLDKHGIEGCKVLPDWFKKAYNKMLKEVYGN